MNSAPIRFSVLVMSFAFLLLICLTDITYACGITDIQVPPAGVLLIVGMLLFLIFYSSDNTRQAFGIIGMYAGYIAIPVLYTIIYNSIHSYFEYELHLLFFLMVVYSVVIGYVLKNWKEPFITILLFILVLLFYRNGGIGLLVLGVSIIFGYRTYKKLAEKRKVAAISILLPLVLILNIYFMSRIVWVSCGTYCQSNLKNIGTALEMYTTDNNRYPESLEELSPEYMREIPLCSPHPHCVLLPIEYEEIGVYKPVPYGYKVSENRSRYTITCQGENHYFIYEPGYPRYTSEQGLITRE